MDLNIIELIINKHKLFLNKKKIKNYSKEFGILLDSLIEQIKADSEISDIETLEALLSLYKTTKTDWIKHLIKDIFRFGKSCIKDTFVDYEQLIKKGTPTPETPYQIYPTVPAYPNTPETPGPYTVWCENGINTIK